MEALAELADGAALRQAVDKLVTSIGTGSWRSAGTPLDMPTPGRTPPRPCSTRPAGSASGSTPGSRCSAERPDALRGVPHRQPRDGGAAGSGDGSGLDQNGQIPPMAAVPARLPPDEPAAASSTRRTHDREVVDLLFFPTGGGKTEAYLGLAAFTLVLRRLQQPGRSPRRA